MLEPFAGVPLVPDRQDNGTNLIRLPVECGFRFSYGPCSFERHLQECARLGLPAFGAYAGGLNVRDRAIVSLFGALSFTAHMLGEGRLYAVPAARCLAN